MIGSLIEDTFLLDFCNVYMICSSQGADMDYKLFSSFYHFGFSVYLNQCPLYFKTLDVLTINSKYRLKTTVSCVDRESINSESKSRDWCQESELLGNKQSCVWKLQEYRNKMTTNIKTDPELQEPPLSLKLVSN